MTRQDARVALLASGFTERTVERDGRRTGRVYGRTEGMFRMTLTVPAAGLGPPTLTFGVRVSRFSSAFEERPSVYDQPGVALDALVDHARIFMRVVR